MSLSGNDVATADGTGNSVSLSGAAPQEGTPARTCKCFASGKVLFMSAAARRQPAKNPKPHWNHHVAGVPPNRKSSSRRAIAREILKNQRRCDGFAMDRTRRRAQDASVLQRLVLGALDIGAVGGHDHDPGSGANERWYHGTNTVREH